MKALIRSKLLLSLITLIMMVAAITIPLVSKITHSHAQGTITISEFPTPTSGSQPNSITSGPDGNLWFTEPAGNKIGKTTPSGAITEYAVPTSKSNPLGITAGPDGNIWFTEYLGSKIGTITPSGSITEYTVPCCFGQPFGITLGPDGNLWFTLGNNYIGKITPSGTITEYTVPTSNSYPFSITSGPDGNLWFTEFDANQIGKITLSGTVTEYAVPTSNSGPTGITSGPDGNIWFTEGNNNNIGKITPSGTINEYAITTISSAPRGITTGPDGNLWFVEDFGNKIGTITIGGTVTNEYAIPTSNSYPYNITAGPDGNLWFVEGGANQIGRVNLSSPPPIVIVQKVVTTDGNNNIKTSFAPGDAIHYRVRVNNTNSTKVTATFMFLATGPQQIFSWSGTKSVASGTLAITMASSVPVNALKGTYTLTVTVTYNGLSSTKSNSFTVKPTLQADYSQIWSGYVAEGNSYTDVKGSWTVPTAKCSLGETSRAAIWVGIGGIGGDNYLEQIGTSADCNIGIPHYWAWYEMFPADPVPINCGNGLQANDQISLAEVMNLGGGSFSLSIDTPECSFEITQTSQGAELNSAEWIVEDPPYSGCTPQCLLTHFVTGTKPLVNFSSCSANGNPITANPLLGSFTMTDDGTANGVLKAFPLHTTSGDTAFSVKWVQS